MEEQINCTVNLNRIPTSYEISADFEIARQYHLKHGVKWNYTFQNTNLTGYTSVWTPCIAGYRWLLNNTQNLVTIDPKADINMFVFDEAEWATPTGSKFPLLPNTPTGDTILFENKPFINIATYITDHNDGQKSKSGVHIMLKRLEVDGHIKRGASYRNITIVNFPFRPGKERAIWHLEKAFQHLSGYHGYGGAVARHGIESVVAILNGKVESAA